MSDIVVPRFVRRASVNEAKNGEGICTTIFRLKALLLLFGRNGVGKASLSPAKAAAGRIRCQQLPIGGAFFVATSASVLASSTCYGGVVAGGEVGRGPVRKVDAEC